MQAHRGTGGTARLSGRVPGSALDTDRRSARAWIEALCAPQPLAGALAATLVVAAHPDDESVGAGSRLQRLRGAHFAYVTDGAPRNGRDAAKHGLEVDAYRERRRQERAAALASCGVGPERVIELAAPDQQAALQLPRLARELAGLVQRLDVRTVLTHPYEGGHPDHDASAFAVHAAAALLRGQGAAAPAIVEMACYHAGPHGIEAGSFLPDAGVAADSVTVDLDAAAQERKRALLALYASQHETLGGLPLAAERFRPAPGYDFTRAPHPGQLLYERHPWGMDGPRFRALAVQALAELGLETPL